jgi:tRNA(Ile)-lysidine synthase
VDHDAALLERCHFAHAGASVDLAVSGGPDSLGLLLLALAADLRVTVHHVDHHARSASSEDAAALVEIGTSLGVPVVIHDVIVEPGGNFEARARSARRGVLPPGVLTGHTMDDLAETMVINLLRGAGHDGLAPMIDDPAKPLRDLRRSEVHAVVESSQYTARIDETNDSNEFLRNRVRHEVLPLMCDVARRDVVPLLARQAVLMNDERRWLDALTLLDAPSLADAHCRELREWPRARLRRWLRVQLRGDDHGDGEHPPSADEVERAIAVVYGEVVAMELNGGRRLARRAQRLRLE